MTDQVAAGKITGIFVTDGEGQPMHSLEHVEAIAGVGLEGDRYANGIGHFSPKPRTDGGRQITLIEEEAVDDAAEATGLDFTPRESRRNLATRGVVLNELIGQRFRVGGAVIDGLDYCHPCTYLEAVTDKPVMRPLIDRGGLRAKIVEGGTIAIGDEIRILAPVPAPADSAG